MNPVENKKIEYWKSQLLDTGKRNKMINLQPLLKLLSLTVRLLMRHFVFSFILILHNHVLRKTAYTTGVTTAVITISGII